MQPAQGVLTMSTRQLEWVPNESVNSEPDSCFHGRTLHVACVANVKTVLRPCYERTMNRVETALRQRYLIRYLIRYRGLPNLRNRFLNWSFWRPDRFKKSPNLFKNSIKLRAVTAAGRTAPLYPK